MGLALDIAEWVVWGFSLLLASTFLMNKHADGGVVSLSRRFAILVMVGVLITLVTDISKLHLLWWTPIAYFLNLSLFSAIVRFRASSFERTLMNTDRSQPSSEQKEETAGDKDDEYSFAKSMVAAYVAVARDYLLFRVVDESRLPFAKDDLKTAIKLMLYYQDTDSKKEPLRECYYQLSKYQPESAAVENVQRLTMEAYEKLIEHDGTTIDDDERLAGLLAAAENHLEVEDTEVVDSERKLLEAELKLWEAKVKVDEAMHAVRPRIATPEVDSNE